MKKNLLECLCLRRTVFGILCRKPMLMLLILSLNSFQIQADTVKMAEKVSISFENAPLKEIFHEIESKTRYRFFYNTRAINEFRKISVELQNVSIEAAVSALLSHSKDVSFKILGDQIMLKRERVKSIPKIAFPATPLTEPGDSGAGTSVGGLSFEPSLHAAFVKYQLTVRGTITTEEGEPIPGVNIVQKGTTNGTTSDADGQYSLLVEEDNAVLMFSFIGYETQEVPINSRSVIDITLVEDVQALQEVVVVGYGEQKKVNLTGSVSTVNAEELRVTPMPNITQSLMGRASGLFIKNGNGQPGENETNYNIRGFGDPLIIIDGYPASDNDFNQLDPHDIENISVLKDAASAAVYGARAGNGVILVTTRRGGVSPPKVTYSANYGLQYFAVIPDFVSSAQYARMENMSRYNEGLAPVWTEEDIQKFEQGGDPEYPNVDWWDETLKKYAPQIQHNINMQGGTEKIKYFVSGGYFDQRGLERSGDTKSKRYNLRTNLDVALTDKLDMGINLSVTNQDYIGSLFQMERNRQRGGIMTQLYRSRPYFPRYFPDRTKLTSKEHRPPQSAEIDHMGYKKWNKLTGDAKLKFAYELPFGLKATANFHFYRMYDEYKEKAEHNPQYEYDWDTGEYTITGYTQTPSRLYERREKKNNLDQQYFLSWNKAVNDHNINALVVYEVLSNDNNWIEASRIRYDFDIDYLFAGPDLDKDNNGRAGEGGRKGWVTRLNYDYRGKYLIELNSRLDASPKFPEETRWGFFPSASVGWRMSEEPFIRDNFSFIDNLKLRASYGELGYDDIGNFQYLQTYRVSSQHIFDGTTNELSKGIRADALANPSITWEKMKTTNVGLDFILWNSKLEGSFDYFYRLRSDVLGKRNQSIPNTVGANMPEVNYAEYDNRGVELALNHRNRVGSIDYSFGGNVSWNREKSLIVDQDEFASDEARRRGNRIGEWTDRTWRVMSDGLFKTKEEIENWADQDGRGNATILPGDVKLIDYNGDGRITSADQVIVGRGRYPKLMFGVNMSVAWKGINFGMLWQGAGLYDIDLRRSKDLTHPFYAGNTPTTAMYHSTYVPAVSAENQWVPANTDARWPRYRTDRYNRGHASYDRSEFWLINGKYLRLKHVELGYTIPEAITQKAGIERCKIYVSGYNLLTFSALDVLDPEADQDTRRSMGDYYPPVGTYNLGAVIQF